MACLLFNGTVTCLFPPIVRIPGSQEFAICGTVKIAMLRQLISNLCPPMAAGVAIAGLCLCVSVKVAEAQAPTILSETSSTTWPVPMFSAQGHPQCDADGNLFFRISLSLSDTSFLEIAADGLKYHLFEMPANNADSTSYRFGQFNVTPSGELRVLTYGSDQKLHVFLFHADFSGTTKTKLESPAYLHVDSFATFGSGAILVTGFFTKAAGKEHEGKRYTAIFAQSGKLNAVLGLQQEDVDFGSVGKKFAEGGAALGEEGFLYLLRPNEILVISESGTVVRRVPFKKPSPELLATRIDVSGGLVDVELVKVQGMGKPIKTQFLVLNASTGERVAYYEPEPALGNNMLCFSRTTGFVFFTVRNDKSTALTAAIR